jgi:hypothetical protein
VAPINPPSFLQAGTYPARVDRLSQSSAMAPDHGAGALAIRGGVRPTPSNTGLQVTQRASPAMFVTVAAGVGYVPAQSAVGGCYVVNNDASYDVAIAAAHGTLGRRDLIIARVYDAEYSGASNIWGLESITGTAAGSPVLPATPAGSIALAQVQVNAGSSTVTNANITDLRAYTTALGGTVPCLSTARPASPYEGMAIYETNNNRPKWWNGTTWEGWSDEDFLTTSDLASYLSANGYLTASYLTSNGYLTQSNLDALTWSNYTPIWGASTSNPSLGNGTIKGRYFKVGSFVAVQISMNLGSTTGIGNGMYSWSVPFTPAAAATGTFANAAGGAVLNDAGTGQHFGVPYLFDLGGASGYRIRVLTNSTVNSEVAQNHPFTWANGDDLTINIFYEVA